MDPTGVTLGLGLGNMLFGMGDRERQKTREHRADMIAADQTRMAPWLGKGGGDAAAQQAARYSQEQKTPEGAIASGATSMWAQLQQNQQAEEAAKRNLAADARNAASDARNERSVAAQEAAVRNTMQPMQPVPPVPLGVSALNQPNAYSPFAFNVPRGG